MQCTSGCVLRQLNWYQIACISNAGASTGLLPLPLQLCQVIGTNHPVEVTDLSLQMVRSDHDLFHAGLVVDKLAL
jgi:hypothetical protein